MGIQFFFGSNFEMKTLSAFCLFGFAAAMGPPWSAGTVGMWMMTFRTEIDPTHRLDPTGRDQTSEDIDTVMDAKGWPKCEEDDRWKAEFPWEAQKDQNSCQGYKEWDEYRHYLFTKAALDVCDGTVANWAASSPFSPPAEFVDFACTFCYKTQNAACTMDGGFSARNFDGTTVAADTAIWFQNAPRNLAECSGTPPVCPGNPPIGHVGDFPNVGPTTTTATTTPTTTTVAANTTTTAGNATTTAGTDSSALMAGATLLALTLL